MARGQEENAMRVFYDVLKPGGVFGVVEHRGNPSVPQDPKSKSGYVNEAFMIELAESAGFVLEASSEINANPQRYQGSQTRCLDSCSNFCQLK